MVGVDRSEGNSLANPIRARFDTNVIRVFTALEECEQTDEGNRVRTRPARQSPRGDVGA